ncbi:MAG TPA: pseudouridine synthase [Rudaea sp.]|nr:pseudouridine synthase [Rudaea sp.]
MAVKRKPSPRWRHRGASGAAASIAARPPRHGLARVLSKFGVCSRTQAQALIRAGRVRVDGCVVSDPETPTDAGSANITLDGVPVAAAEKIYLMLNKPRGYVTTARDERGRDTVYTLLQGAGLPWLGPAGRLDKASEGLLLLSNDGAWAARLTDPATHLDKTYHVQVDTLPEESLPARLLAGIEDAGEHLAAKSARELRRGAKNAWLQIVLDEGRNRQIRRLLAAFDINVLRLVRVAIGPLELGTLAQGKWRALTPAEVEALGTARSIRLPPST